MLPRHTTLELGSLPTAIACARAHARNVLAEWGLAGLADDTELIVSELMTNALDASLALPGRPPIALRLASDGEQLVIEAWDQSPRDLAYAEAGDDAECGRGLAVVAALSQQWGVRRTGSDRKTVWAALKLGS